MPYASCGCHFDLGRGVLHTLACIQKASKQIAARDDNWRRPMGEDDEAPDAAPVEGAVAKEPEEVTESDDQDARQQLESESEQVERDDVGDSVDTTD